MHTKGVDKGGGGGFSPPILAAKINYLKVQETRFIAYAIFHCVMVLVSGVAPPPVEKSCLHPAHYIFPWVMASAPWKGKTMKK